MRTPSADGGGNFTGDLKIGPRRGLTLDRVWALLPVLIASATAMASRMVAIDLAYQVRAGDGILRTGHIPRVDTFTFSVPGGRWFDQQWGAQVLLALTHRLGGWATTSLVRAGLVAAAIGLVYLACRARGASPRTASVLSLCGFLVAIQALAMRPQLFAITLFAACLWALASRRAHPGRVWLAPVFAAVWANVHGTFVLAPLLVGLTFATELAEGHRKEARRLLVVGAATVAATFITPFGPSVWTYAYQLVTNPVVRNNVTEWAPVTIRSFGGAAFFGSALGVMAYLARREERVPWADLLWLTGFFVLALPAVRGIVWWGLVAPVIVAGIAGSDHLETEERHDAERAGSAVMNRLVVAVLVAGLVIALPYWRGSSATAMLSQAPVGLSDAVNGTLSPDTRLFVSEPWASWFEFAQPSIPVFTDPRIEIFPASVWNDYNEIHVAGSRWQQVLDSWKVQAVVVDRDDFSSLLAVMRVSPLWTAVYEDRDGVLFVRAGSPAEAS
ncbi:MAG: hypothetical protein M3P11_09790 [Actinomycetota bacterium]|nr:hypothetical protein [Actinomycetota bacterium]